MGEFERSEFRFNANKHINVDYYVPPIFSKIMRMLYCVTHYTYFTKDFFILKMACGLIVHKQM
jgi:hypothetical protein